MSKKRCFFLKGFLHEEVDKKYGLCIISNIDKEISQEKKTDISDILEKKEDSVVSFIDDKNDKCLVTMIDWLNIPMPVKTDISCFWCRHPFHTKPLGCPIKFINNRIEKSYVSQITKDKYFMKENITKTKLQKIMTNPMTDSIQVKLSESEYYLTDGVFCSFNCIIAFIEDNSHDFFYKESKSLTYSMYRECINKNITKIKKAPHWRLLKTFGGPLSIDLFRESFNMIEYEECSFHMKTLSKIFKEK
jgi:hypothetical protein